MRKRILFLLKGIRLIGLTSMRMYRNSSDVEQIRNEVLGDERFMESDSYNLRRDRYNIESDIRKSFNKIAYGNG